MKKLLSLLLVFTLLFGAAVSVSAATNSKTNAPVITEVTKTGVIKLFNAISVVVNEDGKTVGYTLAKDAKVEQMGNPVEFMEVAMKGLKITYKVQMINGKPKHITYMDVPAPGLDGEGYLSAGINSLYEKKERLLEAGYVPFNVCLNNIRTNITDSSLAANKTTGEPNETTGVLNPSIVDVKEIEPEEDTAYVYDSEKRVDLGDINIIKDSLKVTLNGKELKVIDSKAEFNATTLGDEVKLNLDKTFYYLEFEQDLPKDNLEEALVISFKKSIYKVTSSEFTTYNVNDDVYTELNGMEVSLAKALNRANYAFITTNGMSEIIYINAFYKNLEAEVVSVVDNKIGFKGYKFGKAAFEDALFLSEDVQVMNAKGEALTIDDVMPGDVIKITVDPASRYQVILIEKK